MFKVYMSMHFLLVHGQVTVSEVLASAILC